MANNRKYAVPVGVVSAVALTAGLVAGCGNQTASSNSKTDSSMQSATYPLNTQETLSSWQPINSNLVTFVQNFGDSPFAKQLAKDTGVQVKYTNPDPNTIADQFNLLIASNTLPDIIEYNWSGSGTGSYPGGPQKAIGDKVILPLNDLINKYAPNLKKVLQQNPELDKEIKTDDGQYYVFPMIRDDKGLVYDGPMLRKDWLDELGLQVPTTIDEWHTVLTAFKDKKGATAPFSAVYNNTTGWSLYNTFIGAFNTADDFYVDDSGKVRFGPIDPQYKDALSLLHSWYAEGLIDKDFSVTDTQTLDRKIFNGQTGATTNATAGGMGRWLDTMRPKDPTFDLVAAPYPTLQKGQTPFIGQRAFKYNPGSSAAITTSAKDPALAAKWLDYAYSDKGNMLFNFGIEGQSYTLDNGTPKFTDNILHNPKYNFQQMLSQYTKLNGPFNGDSRRSLNTYPEQDQANQIWAKTDAQKHILPPFITPTADESKIVAKTMTAVNSYREEMFVKFIMGQEPLSNYDNYVAQMKSMGIDQVITIYQNALDRYNKR